MIEDSIPVYVVIRGHFFNTLCYHGDVMHCIGVLYPVYKIDQRSEFMLAIKKCVLPGLRGQSSYLMTGIRVLNND